MIHKKSTIRAVFYTIEYICSIIIDVVPVASSHSHSYRQSRRTGSSQSTGSVDTEDGTPASAAESASVPMFSRHKVSDNSSFVDWLMQHVDLALTHGFDDNIGRNPVPAVFELAPLADWFAIVNQLHHVFWADLSTDSRLYSHFILLKSLSDSDVRFSERLDETFLSIKDQVARKNDIGLICVEYYAN